MSRTIKCVKLGEGAEGLDYSWLDSALRFVAHEAEICGGDIAKLNQAAGAA